MVSEGIEVTEWEPATELMRLASGLRVSARTWCAMEAKRMREAGAPARVEEMVRPRDGVVLVCVVRDDAPRHFNGVRELRKARQAG